MKNLKLTLLTLTAVFALTFYGCKKQDLQPTVTSDLRAAANFTVAISYISGPANYCDDYLIVTAKGYNPAGKTPGTAGSITLCRYTNASYTTPAACYTESNSTIVHDFGILPPGTYYFKATFTLGAIVISQAMAITVYGSGYGGCYL